MDSILNSIKTSIGVSTDMSDFDVDLIMSINSVIGILTQMGVGPSNGFIITGSDETWYEFLGDNTNLQFVKTYIQLKTKELFDPSTNSSVSNARAELLKELVFRIRVEVDRGD